MTEMTEIDVHDASFLSSTQIFGKMIANDRK